jgi:hypothetical protein
MAYVRTGGMSTAARRRRRRTALVLTALTLMLAVVLVYAVAYYQGWLGGSGTAADAEQATATAAPLQPGDVRVNVYNATGEAGLAGRTSEELETRGFVVDAVDNDPEDAQIGHTADIRHGPDGLEAAQLLQQSVPGSKLVADERESEEIDLVLGDGFEQLAPAESGSSEETSEAEPTDG